jgi:CBS domain-containing protein
MRFICNFFGRRFVITLAVLNMKQTRNVLPHSARNSLGSIGEITNPNVATIGLREAASVARNRMRRKNVRYLMVTEDGELRGIVSESDFGSPNDGNNVKNRMVEDVMTPRVVSVAPDTTLEKAASLIGKQRIGCLPVLEAGQIVGMVTATEVYDELQRRSSRAPLPGWLPRPDKVQSGRAKTPEIPAHIRMFGADINKEDRDHLRQKLGSKLGKFADSIERVSVRIKDVNGPRGGVDQVCQIKVALIGLPSVVFEAQDSTLDRAISKALGGIQRVVRQSLQRRRMEPLKAHAHLQSA